MVKTFKLEILASDHVFYSGECDELIFPGQDGSFGILPNHQPMITCLNAGELRYRTGDQWHYAVVSDGFVEIMPSYVTLLADTVERPEEIDEKRAEAAKERAEEKLRQKQSISEYYHTQAALSKAVARLKISSKYNKHKINKFTESLHQKHNRLLTKGQGSVIILEHSYLKTVGSRKLRKSSRGKE